VPFLPSVRFGVDTRAAPDEVRERLLGATGAGRATGHPFSGTVGTGTFELRPVLGYRNSFAPIAHDSFATGIAGTRVEVVMRPLPSVSIFMAVWLTGVAAFLIVGLVVAVHDPSRSWFALIALVILGFGYGLMMLGFSFEARRMRGSLERLFASGVATAPSPRMDLSWLSDFRLQSAERPERLFNRIFLAAYAASGTLAVFTWERTLSSCSNPQYHRRDEFSCPRDTRIGATWALIAVLVAAGLASRVAIHRRLRQTYVPLVLVVVAVGVAAAWMLTHHPRWGVAR
jgi:hypothetical protein